MQFVKEVKCTDHQYGITDSGTLFVKGKNYFNMLGVPDYKPVEDWKEITESELVNNVDEVIAQYGKNKKDSTTVFLITKDRNLWASGDNQFNQTGINQSKKIEIVKEPKYPGEQARYEVETLMINRLFKWTKITNDLSDWPIENNTKRVYIATDKSVYLETYDRKILKAGIEKDGFILRKWTLVKESDPYIKLDFDKFIANE